MSVWMPGICKVDSESSVQVFTQLGRLISPGCLARVLLFGKCFLAHVDSSRESPHHLFHLAIDFLGEVLVVPVRLQ